MKCKLLPDQEYLIECFNYDIETGALIWRNRPVAHFLNEKSCVLWNAKFSGKIAGKIEPEKSGNGYVRTKINYSLFRNHRIVWKLVTGHDPIDGIAHKDLNGLNNRWNNLREASQGQNVRNTANRRNNTSGLKGTSFHLGKWRARITILGVEHSVGRFDTQEDAYRAYCDAASRLHGDFANFG
jgi:hypothetical protein